MSLSSGVLKSYTKRLSQRKTCWPPSSGVETHTVQLHGTCHVTALVAERLNSACMSFPVLSWGYSIAAMSEPHSLNLCVALSHSWIPYNSSLRWKINNVRIYLPQGCDEFRDHVGWSSKENHEQHSDYESTNATFTRHWHPSVIDISPLWGRWQTERTALAFSIYEVLLEDTWFPGSFLQWIEELQEAPTDLNS